MSTNMSIIGSFEYSSSRNNRKSDARRTLFVGKHRDGYWTNNDVCEQLKAAIELAKKEFPQYDHIFVYDNAPTHTKKSPTAPSARPMTKNVSDLRVQVEGSDGQKERVRMDDAILPNGSIQSFYYSDKHSVHPGKFKGMVQLLRERGIDAAHLKAQCKDFKCDPSLTHCCCRRILYNIFDANSPTIIETLAASLGSRVIFLPKYHCELNPIEQVWGYAKSRYRTYPESSRAADLRENIKKALAEVPITSIQQ